MFKQSLYKDNLIPKGYVCEECNKSGVRLYREYQAFLEDQVLRCRSCAIKNQNKQPDTKSEHSIGWLVAAVPKEGGISYWSYSTVPENGVQWWNNLPKEVA